MKQTQALNKYYVNHQGATFSSSLSSKHHTPQKDINLSLKGSISHVEEAGVSLWHCISALDANRSATTLGKNESLRTRS